MADEIERKEESSEQEVVETPEKEEAPESSSTEETDWKALAEAEKARADAAEALIVKNKNIQKRSEKKEEKSDEDKSTLSEERVLELIRKSKEESEDPAEKALADAQKKVRELAGKKAELERSLKKKDTTRSDTTGDRRDGEKGTNLKLSPNSPLAGYEYKGNRIYAKKLTSGKTMYVRKGAQPGEKRTWTE